LSPECMHPSAVWVKLPAVLLTAAATTVKPMNGKPPGKREPSVPMPHGGHALRCKATNRAGRQCGRPARKGYNVCGKHGAGFQAREARGEKRPPGRPPTHGLYSRAGKQGIQDLMRHVDELDAELDNSDYELKLLKATLWYMLEQTDRYATQTDTLDELLRGLHQRNFANPAELHELNQALRSIDRIVGMLDGYTGRLMDGGFRIITAIKNRAETRAKLAETRALETLVRLATTIRNIVWDSLDVFEDRLRREVFTPNRLALPEAVDGDNCGE
jgi:hypothetical protein